MSTARWFAEAASAPGHYDSGMLEAVNLTKRYNGATALDNLMLRVSPGEVFCLLGANGAGRPRPSISF
jgi:ABC-type uncharacterized transport system ATPase subunit